MSLILKGIDLPNMGEELVIYICSDGLVGDEKYGTLIKDAEAIQIPKGHGRLIDVSDLYICGSDSYEQRMIDEGIADAPTILEAEE